MNCHLEIFYDSNLLLVTRFPLAEEGRQSPVVPLNFSQILRGGGNFRQLPRTAPLSRRVSLPVGQGAPDSVAGVGSMYLDTAVGLSDPKRSKSPANQP